MSKLNIHNVILAFIGIYSKYFSFVTNVNRFEIARNVASYKPHLLFIVGHVGTVYDLVVMQLVDTTKIISASYDRSLRVSPLLIITV